MDSPLALYRRYRPDTFAQVIGQEHVTDPLKAALRNNRVNHAYLFSGPRGCGKTTSARILARTLNCAQGPTDVPCGECDSCVELATGGPGSVDVIEIDAASHGGVDDARELREQATFQPMRDRYKIYIVDEAHMVTPQGFNALLKIVEEPPEHVRFIFATTEPDKVIGTVRSRTHHYPFRLIPPKVLSAYLSDLCAKEQVAIEPAALPLVVRAGGGSARDTLSILDQLLGGAGPDGVTYALTTGLLGFTPETLLDDAIDSFAAHDAAGVFGVVERVIETGQDPRRFTEDLLQRFRDLVIVSAVPEAISSGLIDVPTEQADRLMAQASRFGRAELSRCADVVAVGLGELKGTSTPRLLLELLCARLLLPRSDDSELGVLARLDALERLAQLGADKAGSAPSPSAAPSPHGANEVSARERARAAVRASTAAPQTPAIQGEAPPPARATTPAPVPQGSEPPQPSEQSSGASEAEPTTIEAVQLTAQSGAEEETQPLAGGALKMADIRRLWPEVTEAVKGHRRLTWIQLTQHSQVIAFDGRTITLGFNNAGARDSFVGNRSDGLLVQVLIELVGVEFTIESVIDPSVAQRAPENQPSRKPPATATQAPAPTPAAHAEAAPRTPPAQQSPSQPSVPDAHASSKSAQPGPGPSEPRTRRRWEADPAQPVEERNDPDDDVDPADPIAEPGATGRELLAERLGAQLIEEIPRP